MKTIYCISGLGATARAFSKLHIEGYRLQVIEWLQPLTNESIEAYAARMSAQIKEERPVLMGLSFGGMMSIEIARQVPVEKVILISSIKSKYELPWWMRTVAKLKLHKLTPLKTNSRITRPVQNFFLGTVTAEDREVAVQFRCDADVRYVKWAIDKVLNWQNTWQPSTLVHIHGNADKMFPHKKLQVTHLIENGGHFMIMNKAGEVSAAIRQSLQPVPGFQPSKG
ncbi:MAG: alpha/beta hydrolase [Ferruginibacter sp.]